MNKILHYLTCWIGSWIEILCCIINIVTFCYYRPWWDFAFMFWVTKKKVKNGYYS